MEALAPDRVWCLGDLVGYGAQPNECVALARERCDLSLAGNHDLVVTGEISISDFSASAAAAVRWTRDHIDDDSLEFLRGLEPVAAGEEIGLYHASPRDPVWEYVISSSQADACMNLMERRVESSDTRTSRSSSAATPARRSRPRRPTPAPSATCPR